MCAKQWWRDPVMAQPPLLVLPQALLARVPVGGPKQMLSRVPLRQKGWADYMKTVQEIKERTHVIFLALNQGRQCAT